MLAWIVYSLGTFLAGMLLSLIVSFFSGGPTKRAEKPFRTVIACLLLTMTGPFVYVEVLTHMYGKSMEHALKELYQDAPIDGPMLYYRVTKYDGQHAQAYVVGQERSGGMTDRPVLEVSLSKTGAQWKADAFHVIVSSKLNRDNLTFPPYG